MHMCMLDNGNASLLLQAPMDATWRQRPDVPTRVSQTACLLLLLMACAPPAYRLGMKRGFVDPWLASWSSVKMTRKLGGLCDWAAAGWLSASSASASRATPAIAGRRAAAGKVMLDVEPAQRRRNGLRLGLWRGFSLALLA